GSVDEFAAFDDDLPQLSGGLVGKPERQVPQPRRDPLERGLAGPAHAAIVRHRRDSCMSYPSGFFENYLQTGVWSKSPRRDSGGQVVGVRPPLLRGRSGSDPVAQARAQSMQTAAEFVAIALHDVLDGQIRQLLPGQAPDQVPDGPLRQVPRVRPECATRIAEMFVR